MEGTAKRIFSIPYVKCQHTPLDQGQRETCKGTFSRQNVWPRVWPAKSVVSPPIYILLDGISSAMRLREYI